MASSGNLLTHEEIWDDSSLVSAWDEALQEYKRYHSIDATGGNKQRIIRQAEEAEMQDAPTLSQVREEEENVIEYQTSAEDGELDDEGMENEATTAPHTAVPERDTAAGQEGDYKKQAPNTSPGGTGHEQTPAEGTGDQNDAGIPGQTDTQAPPPPPFPINFVGDVKGLDNEALRNLMMSWYFAGYYTGLYEGQQQVQQQYRAQQPPQ